MRPSTITKEEPTTEIRPLNGGGNAGWEVATGCEVGNVISVSPGVGDRDRLRSRSSTMATPRTEPLGSSWSPVRPCIFAGRIGSLMLLQQPGNCMSKKMRAKTPATSQPVILPLFIFILLTSKGGRYSRPSICIRMSSSMRFKRRTLPA